jgi:DHA1 family bicyclomycin/chloramphenicol resistance-like MFS transporter
MHPQGHALWRGPRWTLALLLACLGTLGPFSIDTYLPAFDAIGRDLRAPPALMQQTLSAYLLGFALMNLFHGALSDSLGRRPVVLWAILGFTLASIGCALSQSISSLIAFRAMQGLAGGAGMVVSRAIIRDLFAPDQAQRVMSQVTIYFGVAPAVAPLIGGWLLVHWGWHSIFWFLAAIGLALWALIWRRLPESLHESQRQPFEVGNLLRGYWQMGTSARFLALVLASGVPFNGMFLYVLAAPAWLGTHLKLQPTQFFWFFFISVAGIMAGAWASGRMAASVQAFIGAVGNALTAGVLAPLVMHSTLAMALASAALLSVGFLAWQWVRRQVS